MKEIKQVVTEISGRRGTAPYYALCCAVEIAIRHQPKEPQMKTLWMEIQAREGGSITSISRALSRAVDDIWEHGNRKKLDEIYGHIVVEKPTPKELVFVLAQYMWTEEPKVSYRVTEDSFLMRYGIIGIETESRRSVSAAPFSADPDRIQTLVNRLNEKQTPLEELEKIVLTELEKE